MPATSTDYARQSDPSLNRHFSRRWEDVPPVAAPEIAAEQAPGDCDDAELSVYETLRRWRAEWRQQREAGR